MIGRWIDRQINREIDKEREMVEGRCQQGWYVRGALVLVSNMKMENDKWEYH